MQITVSETRSDRRILLFLVSQAVTLFGSTVVSMAIIWFVTREMLSGLWCAVFYAVSYVPQFLISTVAGAWADRHSRKLLILGADAGIALVTLLLWFVLPRIPDGTVTLIVLMVLCALRSIGAGIQAPAVNAVIPDLAPSDRLMRYNGINATMQSVVQFAAPAAAGAVLTRFSLRATLLIDILTAILGIGLLAFLSVPKHVRTDVKVSLGEDIRAGIRYARDHRIIGRLLAAFGLFILLSVPAGFLAQLHVSRTFGNTYWNKTAVEVIGFLGMLLGGVLMSTWGGFKRRETTFLVGMAAFGMLSVGLGLAGSFLLYLALMLLYGIALTAVQTACTTMLQEYSDESVISRVFGLQSAMFSLFLPLGMAVFGPLGDVVPLETLMVGTGAGLLLLALWYSKRKQ